MEGKRFADYLPVQNSTAYAVLQVRFAETWRSTDHDSTWIELKAHLPVTETGKKENHFLESCNSGGVEILRDIDQLASMEQLHGKFTMHLTIILYGRQSILLLPGNGAAFR